MKTRSSWIGGALVCAAVGSSPSLVRAEVGSTQFNPVKEWTPTQFPWSSGFIPANGPLQIDIGAVAYQEVLIGLPGDAHHDFDASEIWFVGADGEGVFSNTLGAEITATIAVDVGIVATQFEVGVWDIAEEAAADAFTPYLLPGNPDRPATVAELIGPFNLVEQPFSVAGVEGTLVIDYAFDVPGIVFEGDRIDVTNERGTAAAPDASVDMELAHEPFMFVDPQAGELATAHGTMHGSFSSAVALHIYPTVNVVVGGLPLAIGPFDLVVDYPVITDEPVVFDQLSIMIEVPEAPPAPDTTGGADDTTTSASGDGDGGGSDGDTTAAPADDGSSGSEPTGGVGGGLPGLDDGSSGCGCRARGEGPVWAIVGVVVLGAIRRRSSVRS